MRETGGWVWPENVRTTAEYLSRWVGCNFDDSDWQAIAEALPETSWEAPERWYDYLIVGSPSLTVGFARDPNADPVVVRISGDFDDILGARIDTLLAILADVRPHAST